MKTFNKVYNVLASKYIRRGLELGNDIAISIQDVLTGDELYYEDCYDVESTKVLKDFNEMKVYSFDVNNEYYELDNENYKTLITFNIMNPEQAVYYEN